MKKLLLIPTLLLSGALMAQDYNYEITPVMGYNIPEGLHLDHQPLAGAEVQYNDVNTLLKPELSVLHTDADYENSSVDTDIYRIALHGVYEYESSSLITPLAKVGVGYETIDKHLAENTDSAFLSLGAGAKLDLTYNLALKLEAIYMNKFNNHRWDNNLAFLGGLSFSFGEKAQRTPEQTSQNKSIEEKPKTLEPSTPAAVDLDSDYDGIKDSKDKCPNTPTNTLVNAQGCPIIVNLHLNFDYNSYQVTSDSNERIEKFAKFLKTFKNFSANITGHTDSAGNENYNLDLSKNRANAVKKILISKGIEANRISTCGEGESTPIATNDTAEGRAKNRRIEAELIKN